jgi:hypothetical protein
MEYDIIDFINYDIFGKFKRIKYKLKNRGFVIINPKKFNDDMNEFILIIDYKKYIKLILKSYNNDKDNINKQFYLDFNRLNLYINGNYVNNYIKICKYLSYKYKKDKYKVLALLTQSSMASLFEELQLILSYKNYILCDVGYNMQIKSFNIYLNTTKNKIIYEKQLKIIKFDNESNKKELYNVLSIQEINLNKDKFIYIKIFITKII